MRSTRGQHSNWQKFSFISEGTKMWRKLIKNQFEFDCWAMSPNPSPPTNNNPARPTTTSPDLAYIFVYFLCLCRWKLIDICAMFDVNFFSSFFAAVWIKKPARARPNRMQFFLSHFVYILFYILYFSIIHKTLPLISCVVICFALRIKTNL